ncbi:unnamed protein product (macronuclear) [Paramecium tetraurelia]|uniref:Uncharacterized protein n=1 Tax=Paramecium tetraurelia TaxID=5888 RepID=A0BJA9_PARTE|nr:uncharacterized protein GSPATT00004999001 [Paramecium tetraurelia]CAK58626.1 unnamed protein product [Paramecium tetraurelia]|eukprot:XP_001426024.1 hypothetical protein (macronuclear) [Paramecium tetraurelia strain d4-2]
MILSFFYWNSMEQNKKKNASQEKKVVPSVCSSSMIQQYEPKNQIRRQILEEEQIRQQRKRYTDKFQPKATSEDEDPQLNFLQIGNKAKKRQKSQTQRWQKYENRKSKRNRSEQRFAVTNQIQGLTEKYYEFDDLDKISDDKADLCIRNLPQNRLMKKMTI